MPHRVFVVESDPRITDIFMNKPEFRITRSLRHANIVVWPGGPDISPSLYGHEKHPTTSSDPDRDAVFRQIYNLVKSPSVLKVGICGGGQFLNIMSGGTMYQDVDNHCRIHPMSYGPYPDMNMDGVKYDVVSTHHQMMIPGPASERWGVADESTYRDLSKVAKLPRPKDDLDTEVVFYPEQNSLCFQPHPEYGHKPTEDVFFKAVRTCIARQRLSSVRI